MAADSGMVPKLLGLSYIGIFKRGRLRHLPKKEAYELLNRKNKDFVNLIRESGGNNKVRHLLIVGYWTDIASTWNDLFKMPEDPAERCILSVHYYTPCDFCTTNIRHTWDTVEEVGQMEDLIGRKNS